MNTESEYCDDWRVNEFVEGMHVSITIELGNVAGLRDYEFDMTDITYEINPSLFVSCLPVSNTKYAMLATREKKKTVDRYNIPDELALKSQIEELKAENAELKNQMAEIKYGSITKFFKNIDINYPIEPSIDVEDYRGNITFHDKIKNNLQGSLISIYKNGHFGSSIHGTFFMRLDFKVPSVSSFDPSGQLNGKLYATPIVLFTFVES